KDRLRRLESPCESAVDVGPFFEARRMQQEIEGRRAATRDDHLPVLGDVVRELGLQDVCARREILELEPPRVVCRRYGVRPHAVDGDLNARQWTRLDF